MSESAAETDGGTPDVDTSAEGTGTDSEDTEAAGLLDGMSSNDPEALAAELEKWRKESRKWEGRSKANSDAAARLKEIEESNMSELQKAQAAAADAEERATTAMAMLSGRCARQPLQLAGACIEDWLPERKTRSMSERKDLCAHVRETVQSQVKNAQGTNGGRNGQWEQAHVDEASPDRDKSGGETADRR